MSMIGYFRMVSPAVPAMIAGYDDQQIADFLFAPSEEPGAVCEIGKSWAALDVMLIAELGGPTSAILDGSPVGPDLGHGPTRFLTPDQVSEAAATLSALEASALLLRYDADALNRQRVYPGAWTDSAATRQWLEQSFQAVSDVFARCAEQRLAMLLWLA